MMIFFFNVVVGCGGSNRGDDCVSGKGCMVWRVLLLPFKKVCRCCCECDA